MHPPLVAGIYGRKANGARSVVLAGEFADEDFGDRLCVLKWSLFTDVYSRLL